jgi:hypothetical protein
MTGDTRQEHARQYREELRDRLRAATSAEERKAITHEIGRVGAAVRRWRNRAVKFDASPARVAVREATRALEQHDRDGGTVEQRAALVATLKSAITALKGGAR